MPTITQCPPAAAHGTQSFDPHIFASSHLRPINAHQTSAGFVGSGIGFDDYSRMHTSSHKLSGQRRLDTPAWALQPALLGNVIAQYCLNRAGVRHRVTGTPAEKLALAKTLQGHRKKKLSDTLDGLCRLYVAEKNKTPRNYARLRELEIEIEGLDTSIRILGNEAEIAAGVVYHYYHRAADSIAVGQELHLKSPHVRIILWRLRLVAAELGYGTHVKCDARRALRAAAIAPPAPCDEVVAVRMFLEGKKICDIAEAFYGVRQGAGYGHIQYVLRKAGLLSWGTKKPIVAEHLRQEVVDFFKHRDCGLAL